MQFVAQASPPPPPPPAESTNGTEQREPHHHLITPIPSRLRRRPGSHHHHHQPQQPLHQHQSQQQQQQQTDAIPFVPSPTPLSLAHHSNPSFYQQPQSRHQLQRQQLQQQQQQQHQKQPQQQFITACRSSLSLSSSSQQGVDQQQPQQLVHHYYHPYLPTIMTTTAVNKNEVDTVNLGAAGDNRTTTNSKNIRGDDGFIQSNGKPDNDPHVAEAVAIPVTNSSFQEEPMTSLLAPPPPPQFLLHQDHHHHHKVQPYPYSYQHPYPYQYQYPPPDTNPQHWTTGVVPSTFTTLAPASTMTMTRRNTHHYYGYDEDDDDHNDNNNNYSFDDDDNGSIEVHHHDVDDGGIPILLAGGGSSKRGHHLIDWHNLLRCCKPQRIHGEKKKVNNNNRSQGMAAPSTNKKSTYDDDDDDEFDFIISSSSNGGKNGNMIYNNNNNNNMDRTHPEIFRDSLDIKKKNQTERRQEPSSTNLFRGFGLHGMFRRHSSQSLIGESATAGVDSIVVATDDSSSTPYYFNQRNKQEQQNQQQQQQHAQPQNFRQRMSEKNSRQNENDDFQRQQRHHQQQTYLYHHQQYPSYYEQQRQYVQQFHQSHHPHHHQIDLSHSFQLTTSLDQNLYNIHQQSNQEYTQQHQRREIEKDLSRKNVNGFRSLDTDEDPRDHFHHHHHERSGCDDDGEASVVSDVTQSETSSYLSLSDDEHDELPYDRNKVKTVQEPVAANDGTAIDERNGSGMRGQQDEAQSSTVTKNDIGSHAQDVDDHSPIPTQDFASTIDPTTTMNTDPIIRPQKISTRATTISATAAYDADTSALKIDKTVMKPMTLSTRSQSVTDPPSSTQSFNHGPTQIGLPPLVPSSSGHVDMSGTSLGLHLHHSTFGVSQSYTRRRCDTGDSSFLTRTSTTTNGSRHRRDHQFSFSNRSISEIWKHEWAAGGYQSTSGSDQYNDDGRTETSILLSSSLGTTSSVPPPPPPPPAPPAVVTFREVPSKVAAGTSLRRTSEVSDLALGSSFGASGRSSASDQLEVDTSMDHIIPKREKDQEEQMTEDDDRTSPFANLEVKVAEDDASIASDIKDWNEKPVTAFDRAIHSSSPSTSYLRKNVALDETTDGQVLLSGWLAASFENDTTFGLDFEQHVISDNFPSSPDDIFYLRVVMTSNNQVELLLQRSSSGGKIEYNFTVRSSWTCQSRETTRTKGRAVLIRFNEANDTTRDSTKTQALVLLPIALRSSFYNDDKALVSKTTFLKLRKNLFPTDRAGYAPDDQSDSAMHLIFTVDSLIKWHGI